MEIKEQLSELINTINNIIYEKGIPNNFDLEDFLSTLEGYYQELDDIGELFFIEDNWSGKSDYNEDEF